MARCLCEECVSRPSKLGAALRLVLVCSNDGTNRFGAVIEAMGVGNRCGSDENRPGSLLLAGRGISRYRAWKMEPQHGSSEKASAKRDAGAEALCRPSARHRLRSLNDGVFIRPVPSVFFKDPYPSNLGISQGNVPIGCELCGPERRWRNDLMRDDHLSGEDLLDLVIRHITLRPLLHDQPINLDRGKMFPRAAKNARLRPGTSRS